MDFLKPNLLSLALPLLFALFSSAGTANEEIDLSKCELKVYSQNGEDGVTQTIFSAIGTHSKYYVEFGAESGVECNTRILREAGWQGLLMDGRCENGEINLNKEFIKAENINELFAKYNVPLEFDLLSIDIDFNDFHVWKAIATEYRPRVVIIEYNATHLPDEDKVSIYQTEAVWDGTNYFGGSILAMSRLGKAKGYSLVYADKAGVNLFFIRDDIINSLENAGIVFKNMNDVKALYSSPKYSCGPNGGHVQDKKMRPYTSASQLLNIR